MRDAGISTYYDRLSRWNTVARLFGYGGGRDALTVHRALADPRHGGRPTTTRVHDLIAGDVPRLAGALALDAGCGLGGTMLDLSERLECRFIGLTLSTEQAEVGRRAIQARGTDRVQLLVRSYDAPPPGPFALIVAIESLAHSADPAASVSALAAVLAPGGFLVIVDDMPEPGAEGSRDLQTFRDGWRCPRLLSHAAYQRVFARLQLSIAADRDLTSETRPRSRASIAALMTWNRAAQLLPFSGLRAVMQSHLGGLALERLTRDGRVRYRMLVARRPPAFE
jgi:SAM-dependent methyltransferase